MKNESLHQLDQHFSLPEIKRIGYDRPFAWLAAGWRDLRANPIASIAYGLLFAIAGDAILLFAWRSPYFFTAAVSGFFLLAPLLAGGLYEISRRRETGQRTSFVESLAGWGRNGQSMAMIGLILAFTSIIWERTSAVFFALSIPGMRPDLWAFASDVLISTEYIWLTLGWLVVGALLALLVFAVTAISIPMLIGRDADFVTAMMTSLRAVSLNFGPMLWWAAIIVMLTLIGFGTLLFGLILVMPLVGHASWHAYRELVK